MDQIKLSKILAYQSEYRTLTQYSPNLNEHDKLSDLISEDWIVDNYNVIKFFQDQYILAYFKSNRITSNFILKLRDIPGIEFKVENKYNGVIYA